AGQVAFPSFLFHPALRLSNMLRRLALTLCGLRQRSARQREEQIAVSFLHRNTQATFRWLFDAEVNRNRCDKRRLPVPVDQTENQIRYRKFLLNRRRALRRELS